jgi:hypothetical protein
MWTCSSTGLYGQCANYERDYYTASELVRLQPFTSDSRVGPELTLTDRATVMLSASRPLRPVGVALHRLSGRVGIPARRRTHVSPPMSSGA